MKIHGKRQKIFKLTVEFLLIPFLLTACGDSKTTSQQSADDKNFFEKIFSTEKNSPADFLKEGAAHFVAPSDITEELNKAPDFERADAAREVLGNFLNLPPDNAEIMQGSKKLDGAKSLNRVENAESLDASDDFQNTPGTRAVKDALSVLQKFGVKSPTKPKEDDDFADQGDFEREE